MKENLENKKHFEQIIKIKFFDCIFYLNSMFKDCESLSSIKNFQNINMNKINDISQMLFRCSSLKETPDISKWNLNNIKNMSYLFAECTISEILQDLFNCITPDAINVFKKIYMLSSLESLRYINTNTNKIHFMSDSFNRRSSIKSLPDISKWNLSNVEDISGLFFGCSLLKKLPDISKWNLSNVKDISELFCGCSSLEYLPDISKWDLSYLFEKIIF